MPETIPAPAQTGFAAGARGTQTDTQINIPAVVRKLTRVAPTRASLLRILERLDGAGLMWRPDFEGDPYSYFDEGMWPREVTLDAQFTDTDTGDLPLTDASLAYLEEGIILQYQDEFILCTADPNTSTGKVAVQRNWPEQSGLSIGTIPSGAVLSIAGMAKEQGADKGNLMHLTTKKHQNSFAIIEKNWGLSGSQQANDTYVGSPQFEHDRDNAVLEARSMLNRMMLFSPAFQQDNISGTGHQRTVFKGFEGFVKENIFTLNGRFTYDAVAQAAMAAREFNPDENGTFMLFCSPTLAYVISQWPSKYFQTSIRDREFGMDINVLFGGDWRVEIVPAFDFRGPNANKAFLMSMMNVGFRSKKGRSWAEDTNVQTPGADRKEGLVRGEYTFYLRNELSHVVFDGIKR